MRLICKQTGNTIVCMPGDKADLSTVCARCKVEALAHGIRHAAAKPARRAAARRPAEFRALRVPQQRTAKRPACACGGNEHRGADGRTAGERREDAELARELRELGVRTITNNDDEESTMTTTPPPYGYTRQLAAARGEDPEEAAEAEFKRDSDKLARQRTLAKLVREERRLARRHAPPRPYTVALGRKGAAA